MLQLALQFMGTFVFVGLGPEADRVSDSNFLVLSVLVYFDCSVSD